MPEQGPLLSIVIPTRDEVDNIVPVVARLSSALAEVDHEVLFIDDSDDGTQARIAAIAQTQPRVRVVHREGADRVGGLSTAVVQGLRLGRGQYVCVMDADLQHPPEIIPEMLATAEAGADVVVASRYMRGGDDAGLDGVVRRAVSRGARAVGRLLFTEARRSSDPLSGFFLCRHGVLDGIEFRPVGFKILLELLVCVPGVVVRDVPLPFEARAAGESKASVRQGLLYLGHLRSLFLDVRGSARLWKFGIVGITGLAVFLPLVWTLSGPAALPPLAAFLPAFAVSVLWNGVLNHRWTYADQRHGLGEGTRSYLQRAVISGAAMFGTFAGLLAVRLTPVISALGAAVVGMVVNALTNRTAVRRRPRMWSDVATSGGVQRALAGLATDLGADRAHVLPPRGAAPGALPAAMLERVVKERRAAVITETLSHRVQRRSNIELTSTLLVPVVDGDAVRGVLVVERTAPRGFEQSTLPRAMSAARAMVPLLHHLTQGLVDE